MVSLETGKTKVEEMTKLVRANFDRGAIVLWVATGALMLFIAIPLLSIFATLWGGNIIGEISASGTLDALRLSMETTLVSLGIILLLGIPTARVLSRSRFRGKSILDSLIDMPIVLPPAVAGIALLLAFSPHSLIGQAFLSYGVKFLGSTVAVVMAQTFVAMPFFVRSARTAFDEVDPKLEMAAGVLSPSKFYSFRCVVLPLASRGLIAGAILAWGRALGEFGATLMFAGNLRGITQTMPLAIYIGLSTDLYQATLLSAVLIVISFAIILGFRHFEPGRKR